VTEAWYVWMATFGSHVATLRRFLGLTEADLARESGVTEGQVRRFEAGKLLDLSFVDVLRLNRALAKRLRRIDPDLLAPEAKGFLQHLDFLAMPDEDGPPAPGGVPVAEFRIIQDPAIEELVLRFRALDRAGRRAFLQIMRAVAQALRE
jgi:transcriptional regulator with XRE-family HTH domain